MRAFLIDDEELALRRLERLLRERGGVEIIGSAQDPVDAIAAVRQIRPDVIFLDIQMPELTGFDVLAQLSGQIDAKNVDAKNNAPFNPQPLVVFTTAYDQFALKAFEVNSIDYLLKPIEAPKLERALRKLETILAGTRPRPELLAGIKELVLQMDQHRSSRYMQRLASRVGERIEFVDVARVSHFFAKDKLTFAATSGKNYVLDLTIQQLEERLDPGKFLRIHRSTIVALKCVHDLHLWFAGRMRLRLNDDGRTELDVARDRVKALKERLGIE